MPLEDKRVPMSPGVQIRATSRHAEGEPHLAMLTLDIWPLPPEITAALYAHLRDQAIAFLMMHKVVEPGFIDLTTKRNGLPN